ncbi:ATP-binding protein [Thalassospira sp. MCCC 1A03138]|uniref:ATP-binding protein n=1 Tax=Thalassospira sp. MCCC 1A03138 TaxID=1470576 RepID=UPI000A1FBCB1|nr:ATP-binding protein [Thalassospira sp. MCCC 1A03138]OSQ29443.1 hypothetical protein TH468_15000 [Thalassospira sp. MCCC 1A03138]
MSDTQTESAIANESGGAPNANDIKEKLAKSGFLSGLLADEQIKKTLLAELRDLGFKPPLHHLAFRMITATASKSESFIGKSITSRLAALIGRQPKLAGLLQRLINIQHGEKTKDALKNSVLIAITEGRPVDTSDINVDPATSLETMLAIYNVQSKDKILNAIDDQTNNLIETFRQDIANAFQDAYSPVLSWPKMARNPQNLGAFERVKYTSGLDELYGRENEITLLHQFVGDLSLCGPIFNFRWMLLTGDGGTGKTRLAYDFTRKHLDPNLWSAGRLSIKDLQGFSDLAKWKPQKPTFIVIDYAASHPEETGTFLHRCAEKAEEYDFPVRILLLERKADQNWLDRMLPEASEETMILDHVFGDREVKGYPIPPVNENAIISMMRDRFINDGKTPPDNATLLSAAKKVDTRPNDSGLPRPLFALATADALMAETNKDPKSHNKQVAVRLTQEDVLEGMLKREEHIWRSAANKDNGVLRRYKLALALATLQQGLDFEELASKEVDYGTTLARYLPDPPPDENDDLILALGGSGTFLPPLEPDIMGEYFLAKTLLEDISTHRHAFLNATLGKGKPGPVITLLRLQQDFPQKIAEIDLPAAMRICKTEIGAYSYAFMAPNWTSQCSRSNDFSTANNFLDAVKILVEAFHQNSTIAVHTARAVFNIIIAAVQNGDWNRVEAMLTRLDTLRSQFNDSHEIALCEAQGTVNIISYAGKNDDWNRVDAMLARLDILRSQFNDSHEIALSEVKGTVNILGYAAKNGDRNRVEVLLSRLDALRRQFKDDPEIALQEARGKFNIINVAVQKGDWERVDAILTQLDATRSQFNDSHEIALREARATLSIILGAIQNSDWNRADATLARLDILRSQFNDDPQIALCDAQNTFNITIAAVRNDDCDRVQGMLARLDTLRSQFNDDPQIALCDAQNTVNIIDAAVRNDDWNRAEEIMARLDTLRIKFNDHRQIALCEAQSAVNIINSAGENGDWDRAEEMLSRLDALRTQFNDDLEIAVCEAQGTVNIIADAAKNDDWERAEEMLSRLDTLRTQFSDDSQIAECEAQGIVNIIIASQQKSNRDRVEDMVGRIIALRSQFKDDPQIAVYEAQSAVNIINSAGENGDWDRAEEMLSRLDALRTQFNEDSQIAVYEALGTVNIINYAANNRDWDRVEAMLLRLDAIASKFGTELILSEMDEGRTLTLANAINCVKDMLSEKPK